MTGLASWEPVRDVVFLALFSAGFGWLIVVTVRIRLLSRRLGRHVCAEPTAMITSSRISTAGSAVSGDPSHNTDEPITVQELIAREIEVRRQADDALKAATEETRPIEAVDDRTGLMRRRSGSVARGQAGQHEVTAS